MIKLKKLINLIRYFITKLSNKEITISHTTTSNNYTNHIANETPFIHKCADKDELIKWIMSFEPTHFLSIQFPDHMKTSNLSQSNDYLRKTMVNFEHNLLGRRWNHKHLFFTIFAENGKSPCYHYHLLLSARGISTECLQKAIDETVKQMRFYPNNLKLKTIYSDDVGPYCLKELEIENNKFFSTDAISTSNILFNIDANKQDKPL